MLLQVSSLIAMEVQVLQILDHRVKMPTAHTFWSIFRHIIEMTPSASALASYLIVSSAGLGRYLFDISLGSTVQIPVMQ